MVQLTRIPGGSILDDSITSTQVGADLMTLSDITGGVAKAYQYQTGRYHIGIGVTSPDAKLQVAMSGDDTPILKISKIGTDNLQKSCSFYIGAQTANLNVTRLVCDGHFDIYPTGMTTALARFANTGLSLGKTIVDTNTKASEMLDVTGNIKYSGYIYSAGTVATTGAVRLANAGFIAWRNAGNTADLKISMNSSNEFQVETNARISNTSPMVIIQDTAGMAAGVGGTIYLQGKYNTSGAYSNFAMIDGFKENATSGDSKGCLTLNVSNGTSIQEYARITSSGKFSIGTTSPSGKLHVVGAQNETLAMFSASNDGFVFTCDVTNRASGMAFWHSGVAHFGLQSNGSNLYWGSASASESAIANWTKAGIMTSDGRMGIGTTTLYTSATLTVGGSIKIDGSIYSTASYIGVLNGAAAQNMKVGGLAITDSYSDTYPANGLFVKGMTNMNDRLQVAVPVDSNLECHLELFRPVGTSSKPIRLRFHQASSYWHRIEAQNNGFHFMTGDTTSNSYCQVNTGDLVCNGNFAVTGTVDGVDIAALNNRVKGATVTIAAGQTVTSWTHNYGSTNYAVSITSIDTPQRHVYITNKTANAVSICIDDANDTNIVLDAVLVGW